MVSIEGEREREREGRGMSCIISITHVGTLRAQFGCLQAKGEIV